MRDLNITLVQTRLHWEDAAANLALFDDWIDGIGKSTDLLVLPEMFTTGFTMNAGPNSQSMEGSSVKWMRDKAAEKRVDIAGSLIIEENGAFYNRLIWCKPDGTLHSYDKKHRFRFAGEHRFYAAGNSLLTVRLNGWRIRPFVCYDLRFPVWTRNAEPGYDVALFVANWPQKRVRHWKQLLPARAIENQSYVIGVNRIGEDGNGISYSGDSTVIDPTGEIVFHGEDKSCAQTVRLPYAPLETYRKEFPAWKDADNFTLC